MLGGVVWAKERECMTGRSKFTRQKTQFSDNKARIQAVAKYIAVWMGMLCTEKASVYFTGRINF